MSWHDAIHEMLSERDKQIAGLLAACQAAEALLTGAVDVWYRRDQAIAFIDGNKAMEVLAMLTAAIDSAQFNRSADKIFTEREKLMRRLADEEEQ